MYCFDELSCLVLGRGSMVMMKGMLFVVMAKVVYDWL
jgi:hypothetical protein